MTKDASGPPRLAAASTRPRRDVLALAATGGATVTRPRSVAIVLGLVVALGLPFLGKALHVDEPFFVAVAENLRGHPLRPYDGAVALDDTDHRVFAARGTEPNTFETLSHPPLVPYLVSLVALASGGAIRETPQRAAFLLFAVLAAYSQHRLARRFTDRPLAATLFLASSPIFVMAAPSLMTDMPSLALSLAAVALFVEGTDSGSPRRLLLAGTLAGLAALTRYVALGLLPLALAYVLLRRKADWKACLSLVPFGLLFGSWCVQNRAEYGSFHLAAAARHYADYYSGRFWGGADVARRAVCDLAALGGTAFPAAVLMLAAGGTRALVVFAACLALAASVVVANPFGLAELGGYGPWETLALVLCLAAGACLVAEAARRRSAASADRPFLALWLAGAVVGTVVLLPFGTARYMLLALPPLALLLHGPQVPASPALRYGTGVALAASLALSLALALADREYADAYRSFAAQVPGYAQGSRAWFIGDWGFRYYMERAGHRYLLSSDASPREGDVVVRPRVAGLHEMTPRLRARVEPIATVAFQGRLPLRLMNAEARAGFYSHGWGLLPFALSRAPLETFDVYRVVSPP